MVWRRRTGQLYLYRQAAPFPGSGCGPAAMRRRGSGRSARDGVWRCGGSDNAAQGAVRSMGGGCRKTPPAAVLFCGGAGIKCPGRPGPGERHRGQAHREPALFCAAGKDRGQTGKKPPAAGRCVVAAVRRPPHSAAAAPSSYPATAAKMEELPSKRGQGETLSRPILTS